ncbi:MAG: beta-ketoacyl-ACP synthase III [Gammaproteobacteria bacterium]|nr:beta-ketoacyl-ACP synthase III [Gammaproteobacteria bacterium]
MDSAVYITHTASFMPNAPVSNDEMEQRLGIVNGKPSRARALVLRSNGIRSRHYAVDATTGEFTHTNAQLTAEAIRAFAQQGLDINKIDCLATGTSIADQLLPNHGVMVHGELGLPRCEIVSMAGVCLSGISALKYTWLAVRAGEAQCAVATGSELASLQAQARHYQAESEHNVAALQERPEIAFEKDFLRWMLSDGAGACLLQNKPNTQGPSLKIKWIDIISQAHVMPACMYAGCEQQADGSMKGWAHFTPDEWAQRSIFSTKQDVRLLNENVMEQTVEIPMLHLQTKRGIRPDDVTWFLPHMSSEYFRKLIIKHLEAANFPIPQERWFTNLATKGNTGSASAYIMLDELFHSGKLKTGETILMYIPESGRFSSGYVYLEVV